MDDNRSLYTGDTALDASGVADLTVDHGSRASGGSIGSGGSGGSVSRRVLLRSAAVGGVALTAGATLAGCSNSSSGSGTAAPAATSAQATAAAATTAAAAGAGAATALAKTADIPVAGGKIVTADGKPIVITQPKAGTFLAFTAVCTHAGCTVNSVSAGVISCPCHGSTFSATDGSVEGGPAPSPLASVAIKVSGDSIVAA